MSVLLNAVKSKFRNIVNKSVEYNVVTRRLLDNALHSKESGVDTGRDLIVSLTTYGKYIYDVCLAVESLLEQTVKPQKVILWISDEFADDDIPQILRMQEQRGLEIRKTKDIRSYKKLIPALKEFPSKPIITFDDDCIYPYDAVESLYRAYKRNADFIYFRVGRQLGLESKNTFRPYNTAEKKYLPEPSPLNFPVGCGGVLYPPGCFDSEVFNEAVFTEICPCADDIWFKAMALKNGFLSRGVYVRKAAYIDTDIFFENQSGRLNATNVDKRANDRQLKAVWDRYNLWGLMA